MRLSNNIKALNNVINKTIEAIEDGRNEIFEISERSRKEHTRIEEEFLEIKDLLKEVICRVDELEIMERKSREKLSKVSKEFAKHSEQDIKMAYETAKNFQVQLSLLRQEEKELFKRRTELEIRLKDSREFLKKAENLTSKVGVALKYLSNSVSEQIEGIKQKKEITYKILQAQEHERQRVSRDIHDGPAQSIANMILKSEYCERLIDVDMELLKNELGVFKGIARQCLKDIRKIIFDLLPMSLTDLGLLPTIQSIVDDLKTNSNIEVAYEVIGDFEIEDRLTKLTVFRIVQEILSNVKKHSRCNEFHLKIAVDSEQITIVAADNGVGFDVAIEEVKDNMQKGFGLYNINERVELLDGDIYMASRVGEGTRYEINLPIKIKDGVIE